MSFPPKVIKIFFIFPLNVISFSFDIYICMHVEFILCMVWGRGPISFSIWALNTSTISSLICNITCVIYQISIHMSLFLGPGISFVFWVCFWALYCISFVYLPPSPQKRPYFLQEFLGPLIFCVNSESYCHIPQISHWNIDWKCIEFIDQFEIYRLPDPEHSICVWTW